eukprot:1146441-Pelagomonas_calceolata.AAC.2
MLSPECLYSIFNSLRNTSALCVAPPLHPSARNTPALDLVAQVLGPHGVQGAQAARGLDVAHHAHDNHGGSLNDGDGLAGLLLVQLGAGLVHIAQDVGAACGRGRCSGGGVHTQ